MEMSGKPLNEQIPSVVMLRGIASLGVCLMHFIGTLHSRDLDEAAKYGAWGVPVFFVISGFIIPYALDRSSYKINNYPQFLLKRIIRLDPPYLLTILGIFLLSFIAQLSPYHTSQPLNIFSANTLYHLFYLVDILGGKWLSPVFWTLAIEFQFYLLIGLLFPLLISRNRSAGLSVILCLSLIPFLFSDTRFVSDYLLFFCTGILLFYFVAHRIRLAQFIFYGLVLLTLSFIKSGMPGLLCPLITILFILFVRTAWPPLIFLGTISYSLYLIHTPVGTDGMINFFQNFIPGEVGRVVLMIISLPVVIFIAWVFHLFIERPSQGLAKKIKY
jgi:peptidoglycan/LPS O-acetylase OafA/YrhL